MMKRLLLTFAICAAAAACGNSEETPPPATQPPTQSAGATIPAAPAVDANAILERIKVLSSDEYEGRAPGTKGEDLTVKYLVDESKTLGLQPGNPDGTYVQKVPLVGITGAQAQPLTITKGAQKKAYKWSDEVVAWTRRVADTSSIADSDIIFAGYGVEAPEFNWNDFKGVDVRGKTIVVLVNDPQVPSASDPSQLDDKVFNGKAMTYYGRWTYKYEKAAELGAAGVFIVHETGPAGYPFPVVQGFLGERFSLVAEDKNMSKASVEGWLSLDAAKSLFAMAGQDFDALKKQALSRDFKPVPLGLKASMGLRNTMRTIDSQNVIAKVEGSDARLKDEYVVYSSHWDHLGVGTPVDGDKIYNGALDNASGVAALLEMAKAFTQAQPKPKRSILFLFVTAEEQGLLGSEFYATNPLYPLEKTVANINLDGVNQWGRTKDITVVGMGASDLDDVLRAAAQAQGRTLNPDPESEKGFYYRSDHFNFAKVGVPALYTDTGVNFVGKDEAFSKSKRDEYTSTDYHKPSDEIKPDWDLSGAVEDVQLMFMVGHMVANTDRYPEWKAGNEFKAKRDAMLGR
ncbi:MAG: M28 family metallopeptidase [Acidobacteriota bacterium]|nr:M20/M25/M40 family metallo-hydrolase [Acidobacteriota bacterium]MDQ3420751.1 M28 family metallopeptidase [Acidobacteriota bacterium]